MANQFTERRVAWAGGGKMIKFKRLNENAILPTRGTPGSAGIDLYAAHRGLVAAGERLAVGTGLAVQIPHGHVGLIWPRSGLAARNSIDTLAGVIDSDYRGEVVALLINHGNQALGISPGDRIAQLLIQPVAALDPAWADELDDTERADGGFGSTGQ